MTKIARMCAVLALFAVTVTAQSIVPVNTNWTPGSIQSIELSGFADTEFPDQVRIIYYNAAGTPFDVDFIGVTGNGTANSPLVPTGAVKATIKFGGKQATVTCTP